jgi:hypothetical protein
MAANSAADRRITVIPRSGRRAGESAPGRLRRRDREAASVLMGGAGGWRARNPGCWVRRQTGFPGRVEKERRPIITVDFYPLPRRWLGNPPQGATRKRPFRKIPERPSLPPGSWDPCRGWGILIRRLRQYRWSRSTPESPGIKSGQAILFSILRPWPPHPEKASSVRILRSGYLEGVTAPLQSGNVCFVSRLRMQGMVDNPKPAVSIRDRPSGAGASAGVTEVFPSPIPA